MQIENVRLREKTQLTKGRFLVADDFDSHVQRTPLAGWFQQLISCRTNQFNQTKLLERGDERIEHTTSKDRVTIRLFCFKNDSLLVQFTQIGIREVPFQLNARETV